MDDAWRVDAEKRIAELDELAREARELEIEDNINSQRHDQREGRSVKPIALCRRPGRNPPAANRPAPAATTSPETFRGRPEVQVT